MTNGMMNTVSVTELKQQMESEAVTLIDVREPDEWQEGYIPCALHMPQSTLAERITAITNKTQPIYLYCHAGIRSYYAAHYLLSLGFERVYSVNGGILEWVARGFPLSNPLQ